MAAVSALTGRVSFKADGRQWRLYFGMNALCELEANVKDEDQLKALLSTGNANFNTVRVAVWAALVEHHPNLTIEDAGRLVDHLGLRQMGAKVGQALIAAYPTVKGEGSARPRKAAWWVRWASILKGS